MSGNRYCVFGNRGVYDGGTAVSVTVVEKEPTGARASGRSSF